MITYVNEIKSVIVNLVRIGFIARGDNIFGFCVDIESGWSATRSVITPDWHGNFATRKEAREWLQQEEEANHIAALKAQAAKGFEGGVTRRKLRIIARAKQKQEETKDNAK